MKNQYDDYRYRVHIVATILLPMSQSEKQPKSNYICHKNTTNLSISLHDL